VHSDEDNMLGDSLEHEEGGDVAGAQPVKSLSGDLVKNGDDASMMRLTTTMPTNSRGTIVHCMKRILRHQMIP